MPAFSAPSIDGIEGIEGIDFSPMLRRACIASVVGFAIKVAVMWRVAIDVHARVYVRSWFGIPYLALTVGRNAFTRVTSSSTVALSFVVLLIVVLAVLRTGNVVRTAGWLFAIVGLLTTLAMDALLQRIERPYTDPQRIRWATGSLALCLLLTAVWVAFERPDRVLSRRLPSVTPEPAVRRYPLVTTGFVIVFLLGFVGLCSSSLLDRPNLLADGGASPVPHPIPPKIHFPLGATHHEDPSNQA